MKILAVVMAVAAWAGSPSPGAGDAAAGKALFAARCAACHGKDARGSAPMAKMYKLEPARLDLLGEDASKLAAADKTKVILEGQGKMKGLKDKLKDEEVASVLAYLQSLTETAKTAAAK